MCVRHCWSGFRHVVPVKYCFRKATCTLLLGLKRKVSGDAINMSCRLFKVFAPCMTTFSLLTAFLLFVPQLVGQGITTGSITGTVEDPQQSVISGATVTAVNNGTNVAYSATTNSVGYFEMRGLPVGSYAVTIDAPGFSKTRLSNVAVSSGVPTSVGLRQLAVQSSST